MKDTKIKSKRLKRGNRQYIPVDYPWKILSQIVRDIENLPSSDEVKAEVKRLRGIIRSRNVANYIAFCKDLSLTAVNRAECFGATHFAHVDSYSIITDIRIMRLLTLFQKYEFHNSPFDQRSTALKKFFDAEAACKRTNRDRIWTEFKDLSYSGSAIDDIFTSQVLLKSQEFIRSVLGEFDVKFILNGSKHGPGATAEKSGNMSIPLRKFSAPLGVTTGSRNLLLYYLYQEDRWLRSLVQHFNFEAGKFNTHLPVSSVNWHDLFIDHFVTKPVEASRVMFVPKSAEEFRTICAEPTGNVFLQLGVDRHIRKKLQRYGLDLSTQEKNRALAKKGSIYNTLSTLDLSSASDTIALATLSLFPPSWAAALKALRCTSGFLEDKEIIFEKLSSMGNGFTFVIETLIFSALLYGVITHRGDNWADNIDNIAVYGDDIICPTRYVSDLIYMLRRCGFSVNQSKSFTNGFIRESCGEDYFCGYRISRPTIKTLPKEDWELYRDHNRLYNFSQEYGIQLNRTLRSLRRWCKKEFFGPSCEDEIGWLFSEPKKELISYTHKSALEWQQPLYVLKKFIVTHPKGRKTPYDEFYVPLMYLQGSSKPWYESSNFKVPPPLKHDCDDFLTFDKIKGRVKVTVQLLPLEQWATPDR